MGPGAGRGGLRRESGGGAVGGLHFFRWSVLLYLALLPLGLFWVVPVAGAMATGSDVLLAGMVVAGIAVVAWRALLALGGEGGLELPGGSRARYAVGMGLGLLLLFGAWTAFSTLWSYHGDYAVAKGLAYTALAAGTACVATSGVPWRVALDAWLAGVVLTVGATLLLLIFGSDGWSMRVAYQGGSVSGLPLPRLRGPFLHPNALGDYLLLSGVFLWVRWPAWTGPDAPAWRRVVGGLLAGALVLFLILSVSSAWLAAGVLLLYGGRRVGRRARRGEADSGVSIRAVGLRALGAVLTGATLAGLAVSVRVDLGAFSVSTGGVRPGIWASAVRAVMESPFLGVGAAPYLAQAVDPMAASRGLQLWDAHNVYLSVLGQFGLVGGGLLGVGMWLLVRRPGVSGAGPPWAPAAAGGDERRPEVPSAAGSAPPESDVWRGRAVLGMQAALLAMAVHGLVIAGEDFRHWWAVLGVVGLLSGRRE